MSDTSKYHLLGFQEVMGSAVKNELAEEARKQEEMRRKRAELQKAQNPNAMTATELLGLKTDQEIAAELGEEFDKQEREAKAAAAQKEEENDTDVGHNFPPPNITS